MTDTSEQLGGRPRPVLNLRTVREKQACRACGSTMTRAELINGGWLNCCPERGVNEVIERDFGTPATLRLSDVNAMLEALA